MFKPFCFSRIVNTGKVSADVPKLPLKFPEFDSGFVADATEEAPSEIIAMAC